MNTKSLKVLIVDDEVALCNNLVELFALEDFIVSKAYSGNEAFDIFQDSNGEFDFILTDITMPNGNGIDLVKKIRAIDELRPIIYMMSGYSEHTEIELQGYGVNRLLPKPFGFDEIKNIKEVLSNPCSAE